jgi:hypothetical protein
MELTRGNGVLKFAKSILQNLQAMESTNHFCIVDILLPMELVQATLTGCRNKKI